MSPGGGGGRRRRRCSASGLGRHRLGGRCSGWRRRAAATATATEVVRRDGRARDGAPLRAGRRVLAVGSADAQIALVDAAAGWVEVARCAGHSSAITQLDWTDDGYVLRSNCLGHELRFWDVDPDELRASATGEQITLASACRDLRWASFGVTLGWHCQGIYASAADGTGVHGVDRSDDGALLATADAYGQVNLLRYPCVARPPRGAAQPPLVRRPPPPRSAAAGSAAGGGDRLVSIGGLDLCVCSGGGCGDEFRCQAFVLKLRTAIAQCGPVAMRPPAGRVEPPVRRDSRRSVSLRAGRSSTAQLGLERSPWLRRGPRLRAARPLKMPRRGDLTSGAAPRRTPRLNAYAPCAVELPAPRCPHTHHRLEKRSPPRAR